MLKSRKYTERLIATMKEWAEVNCTLAELAAVARMSEARVVQIIQLDPEARKLWEERRAHGILSVRRAMMRKATGDYQKEVVTAKGDVVSIKGEPSDVAAIWLSKNLMGWSDRSKLDVIGDLQQLPEQTLLHLAAAAFQAIGQAVPEVVKSRMEEAGIVPGWLVNEKRMWETLPPEQREEYMKRKNAAREEAHREHMRERRLQLSQGASEEPLEPKK